jgi:hypothetical protein
MSIWSKPLTAGASTCTSRPKPGMAATLLFTAAHRLLEDRVARCRQTVAVGRIPAVSLAEDHWDCRRCPGELQQVDTHWSSLERADVGLDDEKTTNRSS